ncbi:unnamed protein product, partial [Polarella glacialis]
VGRGKAAMSETSQTEEMDARLQAVLTRLRSQSAVISQETEPLVGSETDGINKMATSTCSPLKKRVRDFINGNIAEQKKHVRRMMHKRTQRKECFKALPLAEQVAVAEAFNLHKEADGTISLKGSLLAMRELGLRGNSMMERAAVERAVTEMTLLLMDVEEKGLLATVSSTGNKCSWWRTLAEPDLAEELEFLQRKLQMRALSKRPSASSTSPTSPSSPTSPRFPSSPTAARALTFKRKRIPISPNSITQAKVHIQKMQELMAEAQEGHASATAAPLRDPSARPSGLPIEAFGAEILPFARLELYDIRTEPHFRQFVEDLDNGHFSHGISVAQFRNIMLSLKFDQFEGDPEIQQFLEFAAASEQRLDFETLHSKLLRLEELAGRAASTREREVAAASNMTMAFFHQHRAEFLWMFTIFQQYDADRSGYLIHSEAKRLLKHIGLEPYNPVSAAMIDGLLKEIDQDGNFEVDFREFLLLVNLARSHLQKRRKRHLLGAWKELDVDRYGRLSMHLLVPGLASAGLLNSRAEYALAQSFMDESWDLSSFFFEDDLLPSQKRILRSRDDAGSIYFAGFSLFYQQVAERLACIQGERIMSSAKSMGFTMEALSEIQETFDTLDTDGSGSLNKDELKQALNPLLMIPPSPDDVDEILNLIDNDSNGLVDIREFLCLLRLLVTPGGGLAKRVKPFTIRHDVPVLSQREILKTFRISESYVNECEPADVLEMCCNFLTLGADYDLKQLPKPVSNGRQLRDLAAAQARGNSALRLHASCVHARKDGDDFGNSILSRLVEEHQQKSTEEEFTNDVTILFCGAKRSGKTSLVDRFINPNKEEKDVPKPTVALDYKFARYASEASTSKVLAHIYDLGGDEGNDNLSGVPVSPATVGNLVLAITLDLSEPHIVLPTLEKWLKLLEAQVTKGLTALAKESTNGAKHVEASQMSRKQAYSEHPDRGFINAFPVPLVIFGAKWDVLVSDTDPEKRKNLCRALRHFAHVNGASLVFTSLKAQDKASMNAMRGILRQLLFGVAAKGGFPDQLDHSKPIAIEAGKDSLQSIGAPPNGQASDRAWRDVVAGQFPDPHMAQKGGKRSEADQVGDELLKFSESSIDGMVEQRIEELQQYRRQVERNQRLASEGIEGSKLGVLTA